ncbi:hypothetical protein P7C70_g5387, partial [Phenoliferia sp. Uapishka_3]
MLRETEEVREEFFLIPPHRFEPHPRNYRNLRILVYLGWALSAGLLCTFITPDTPRLRFLPVGNVRQATEFRPQNRDAMAPLLPTGGVESPVTIVSGYYRIQTGRKHSTAEYDSWLRNFLTSVELPIVFFCAPSQRAMVSELRGPKPITIISNFDDPFDMPPLVEIGGRNWALAQHALDPEAKIHVPELYGVWTAKPWMVKKATLLDPYLSEFFFWADAGAFREANEPHTFLGLPTALEKIYNNLPEDTLMLAATKVPFAEGTSFVRSVKASDFMDSHDHIQGGWYGGRKSAIDWFEKETSRVRKLQSGLQRFAGKEQLVWTHAARLNWRKIYVQELLSQYIDFTHPAHVLRGGVDGEYYRTHHRSKMLEKWLDRGPPSDKVKRLWVIETFVTEVLDRLSDVREMEIIGRVQGPWEWAGLEKLSIDPCTGYHNEAGWEILFHPALDSLKQLSIQASGLARKRPHEIPPLKFSLEHLSLRTPGNPPPELLDALLTPKCSYDLRSLSIICLQPGNNPQWIPTAAPDLRHLTHVSLSLAFPIQTSISALLGLCTSIVDLTLRDFLCRTSEPLSNVGKALPLPATATTIQLIEGEASAREKAPSEEQYKELTLLLDLPVMSKVRRVCGRGRFEDGDVPSDEWKLRRRSDWKKWLGLLEGLDGFVNEC